MTIPPYDARNLVNNPYAESLHERDERRNRELEERAKNGDEKAAKALDKRSKAGIAITFAGAAVGIGAAVLGAPVTLAGGLAAAVWMGGNAAHPDRQ